VRSKLAAVSAGIEPWVLTTKHSRHPTNLQGKPPDLMRATFLADRAARVEISLQRKRDIASSRCVVASAIETYEMIT